MKYWPGGYMHDAPWSGPKWHKNYSSYYMILYNYVGVRTIN